MSLVNCGRCEQPFLSSSSLSICPSCQSREVHLFESYYYRIEKLIRERGLDTYLKGYPLDKDRFKAAAHFRIGTGLVLTLDGWYQGVCHVCHGKQSHRESKEPICQLCIDTFFKALASSKGLSVLVKKEEDAPAMTQAIQQNLVQSAHKDEPSFTLDEIQRLQDELSRYRNYYGELRPTDCRVVTEEPVAKKVALPMEVIELITEQVMEILSMSDEEISLDNINWQKLGLSGINPHELETIRLSGFKRLPNVF